jgi:hypothetical protein
MYGIGKNLIKIYFNLPGTTFLIAETGETTSVTNGIYIRKGSKNYKQYLTLRNLSLIRESSATL